MTKTKQQGNAAVLAIVIIIFVAVLGFVLWRVWEQNKVEPAHITMGVFGPTLTSMVADAQGYLTEQNLTVEYKQVTSSTQQFKSLRDGEYNVIATAPDNLAQYRLNNSNALGSTFDVQAFAGTNRGQNLTLVVQPNVTSYEQLRGKKLAVDSPQSGFAFVLYTMLRNHGLERGQDYQVVEAGGNAGRYEALLANEFDGTLLLSGFEFRAQAAGKRILESSHTTIPNYLGGVLAGRQSWLGENRGAVERLLKAYQKANDWIFNPANKEAAITLITEQSNVSAEIAQQMYDTLLAPETGLIQNQQISTQELRTVLQLRQEWDGFDESQNIDELSTPDGGLYDLSYLQAATR